MPIGTLAPPISRQFTDANGNPLAGGKLYAYAAGTTTDEPIYVDHLLSAAHTQPAVLDGDGRLLFFLSATTYRFVLFDANDVQISDEDGISAYQAAGVSSGVDVFGTAGEDLATNEAVYLSDGSGGTVAGRWYRTDADDPAKSTLPSLVGFVIAPITSGTEGQIRLIGSLDGFVGLTPGPYFLSGAVGAITTVAPANHRSVGFASSGTTLIIELSPRWTDRLSTQHIVNGRLTLESGVTASATDQTAKTTLYFCPVGGNRIALYDGAALWKLFQFAELSMALPAAANQMYDVFAYDNAGVVALELLAWTNDTTRATALVKQDGVWVKSAAPTRRFLGSCRTTTVAGQTEDSLTKRYVSNYYNRVRRPLLKLETADSWTYDTGAFRQMNNAPANQVDVVVCLQELALSLDLFGLATHSVAGSLPSVAIGQNSTTVPMSGQLLTTVSAPVANYFVSPRAHVDLYPAIGRSFFAALEQGVGATTTFYGDNGTPTRFQAGLSGWIEG